jgi:hypothetical protein
MSCPGELASSGPRSAARPPRRARDSLTDITEIRRIFQLRTTLLICAGTTAGVPGRARKATG